MKKTLAIILLAAVMLTACRPSVPEIAERNPTQQTEAQTVTEATKPSGTDATDPTEIQSTSPQETEATMPTMAPQATESATSPTEETTSTEPTTEASAPQEEPTKEPSPPEATIPSQPTEPVESKEPTPTEQETTAPTEAETTVPPDTTPTEAFKREVAYYAAYYINQYRTAAGVQACTVLPGMTLVAEYRADQLIYNYSHDTADKREALAYYEYGRWVDATIVGLDPSASYYEADTTEAICAGFEGKDAEAMGKYIADLCRNSSNHWSYIGSAKNSYIGIGVEYRAGSAYGWYGCIMVGRTNYG